MTKAPLLLLVAVATAVAQQQPRFYSEGGVMKLDAVDFTVTYGSAAGDPAGIKVQKVRIIEIVVRVAAGLRPFAPACIACSVCNIIAFIRAIDRVAV
jgi:hypothetical protein